MIPSQWDSLKKRGLTFFRISLSSAMMSFYFIYICIYLELDYSGIEILRSSATVSLSFDWISKIHNSNFSKYFTIPGEIIFFLLLDQISETRYSKFFLRSYDNGIILILRLNFLKSIFSNVILAITFLLSLDICENSPFEIFLAILRSSATVFLLLLRVQFS